MSNEPQRLINWGFLIKHPRLCMGAAGFGILIWGFGWGLASGSGCSAFSGLDFVNPFYWGCNIGGGVSAGARGFNSATVQPWQDEILKKGVATEQQRRARITSAPPGAEPPPAIRGGR